MRILQRTKAVLLIDLSNVVARAVAVATEDHFLALLCRMLQKQRRQHPGEQFVFAVEGAGTIGRQRIVPGYKGGRPPTPELHRARNTATQLLRAVDCRLILAPDGEADDAIGTYCCRNPGAEIVILSDDRDLWQLITQDVRVKSRVKNQIVQVDRYACQTYLGVEPAAIPIMKALLGDTSDCIPRGVARLAKKKLLKLAQAVAGHENKLPEIITAATWLTEKDRTKILAALDVVKQHLRITRVWTNLDLKTKLYCSDVEQLAGFLDQYGLAQEFSRHDIEEIAQE